MKKKKPATFCEGEGSCWFWGLKSIQNPWSSLHYDFYDFGINMIFLEETMYSKVKYLLVFVLLMGFCQAYGQQSETSEPAQSGVAKDIQYVKEKGEELQDKVFTKIDSLSGKSADILQTTTDSLNNLSEAIEGKVQSKIDSLQQRLNEIQSKGNQQLSNATEKAERITRRIDSLQNVLSNKLQLDKLNKYGASVPDTDFADKLQIPELEKLSLPGMKGLSGMNTQILKQVQDDGGGGIGALASQVDDQLGEIGDLKNNDWIKSELPGYQVPGEVQEYTELLKDPSNIDQTIDSKAAQMSEFQSLNSETKELAAMKELPESMLADLKRYQDEQALKAEAKEVVVKKATDYSANHQDKLSQAQGMMSKLKKKYSYVPDSRDLSTAVKATSLKNEPLKKRLVFGLGFQIQRTNPISLDLSPNLLYRFNKLFSAGISGTYRASLGIENNSTVAVNTTTDVYGASAIVQHKVWKGFFGHGEFQYLSTPIVNPNPTTDLPTRSWNEGLLLGIGKQMNFSKALKGQVIFTYDFLHTTTSPNPKAWNIKFGFQLGEFKLKDVRF